MIAPLNIALGIVLIILIIIFSLVKSWTRELIRSNWMARKLPSLRGKRFLIGHFGELLGKKPEEAWLVAREWSKTSAPVYTVYMGPFLPLIGVNGPDELEVILGPMKHLAKSQPYDFIRSWLEEGLLTSAGSKWHQRRKILTPAFHFSILLDFIDTFNRETMNFVREIEQEHLNRSVDVVPLISNFTLLTISETSMGTKLDLQTQEGQSYKDAILRMGMVVYERLITPWLWYPIIFRQSSLGKVEAKLLNVLHGFTQNIVRERERSFKMLDDHDDSNSTIKRKYPLLDVLLNAKRKSGGIDDKGIREEVDTFMFEGHDTTSMCLSFTTMLLACHQDIQEEVYEEIIGVMGQDQSNQPSHSDLQRMSFLERCIKESLRLYPPVPMIGRTLSEDVSTKYGTIPRNTSVFIHLIDVHKNPQYWPDPDKFDPSRHLPEKSQGRHPYSFIPFSAGPRNCIGQRFAMLELKAFFCGLLRNFVLEPVDTPDTVVLVQDLILRPLHGIRVKFSPRSQ